MFFSKKLKSEFDTIEQFIDKDFYSKYFFLPIIFSKRIAAIHYCLIGWKKKYNPTNNFSTYYYLEKHNDVKASKENPFLHYCVFGHKENRSKFFTSESEYFDLSKKIKFNRTYIFSAIFSFLIKNKSELNLFDLYFDPIEYRRNIGSYKLLHFASLLKLHYLLKGRKLRIKASQIFDPEHITDLSFIPALKAILDKDLVGVFVDSEYETWINKNENLNKDLARDQIDKFKHHPLISVIIPVYNANILYFKEAIRSVREQLYSNWEICIADDHSTDKELIDYLSALSKDEKIKVVFRKENGHISACSNSALQLAEGSYIALLDQDDLLSSNALFEVVKLLNEENNYKLIFSNEDKIDELGNRFDPYFKKGWNYHLLLSQNYVSHLGVYKTSVVKKIGGFRLGFEGSQDYDLLLRFIEQIKESEIAFINKIIYHWRAIKGSTASNINEKEYAIDKGILALQEHLNRGGQNATVLKSVIPYYFRVKRSLTSAPLVTIIIPTKNHLSDLKKAVHSILQINDYPNFEIIIVDNNSTDKETLNYLLNISSDSRITVLEYPGEFNYSAINNFAVEKSRGELILLLNNDIVAIDNQWLTEMVSQILPEEVAIVGAKLLYPDDTIQHAGVEIGMGGVAGHLFNGMAKDAYGDFGRLQLIQNYEAVTAACLLIKKTDFLKVGGFDDKNLKVAFNDVDLCLKVRKAGRKIVYTPYAELYHFESKSRGSDETDANKERFKREVEFMMNKWDLENHPANWANH